MAKTPQAVRELLERVWKPARFACARDREPAGDRAEEGGNFELAPWDGRLLRREGGASATCVFDEAMSSLTSAPAYHEAAFYSAYRLFG
jgi:peptidyl-dipeptidase Dcp